MDQHIGTSECKYFSIKFDTKQLSLLDVGRLFCVHAARFFNHIAHSLDEKRARPTRCIENSVILIYVYEPIHKGCNMIWCKNLSTFRLFLVSVEFIKENTHYVFSVPIVRIDAIRYFRNPLNKVIDGLLVCRIVHFDFRIYFNQNIEFKVLLSVVLQ